MPFFFGTPLEAIHPPLSSWGLILGALLLFIRMDAVAAMVSGHLLSIARLALMVTSVVVLSAMFGPFWLHMWAQGNLPGLPGWISGIYQYFGGGAWSLQTEMTITLCALSSAVVLVVNHHIASNKRKAKRSTGSRLPA